MDIQSKSYVFESPYHSRIQVGREDPSASKEEQADTFTKDANQPLQEAQSFQNAQEKPVEPRVTTDALLDTYA